MITCVTCDLAFGALLHIRWGCCLCVDITWVPYGCAEGRWRLYYTGLCQRGGAAKGIGLAMTDKEDTEEFEGVRVAFKRRV